MVFLLSNPCCAGETRTIKTSKTRTSVRFQLFDNSYNGEKYVMTPTKLYRRGFSLYEDSALQDTRDAIPIDGESGGSSDEAKQAEVGDRVNVLSTTIDGKSKSSSGQRRCMKKKMSACELSFLVDRATSAAEKVATKIYTMMASNESAGVDCIQESLVTGQLERRTPLDFFAFQLLAKKQYRDMLAVIKKCK